MKEPDKMILSKQPYVTPHAPCAHAERRNISGPQYSTEATMLCSQDCHCIRLRKAPLMNDLSLLDNIKH